MRLLHSADWHLGRLFHGLHLTEDQSHVLDQFIDVARDFRPDVVVIAGDVYDRAVPPPEAVQLLDDVLARLVFDVQAPVVLIAGNHDSPDRLAFGARLLKSCNVHVYGRVSPEPGTLPLEDAHGPVMLYALPYADPPAVRGQIPDCEASDHNGAMAALVDCIRQRHPEGARSVLVAHAFVAGCEDCESERPLSVGGAGTVDGACFDGFDYVALGHLHRRQAVDARSAVCYSGSPLKYSFSEAHHPKSVSLVEMDGGGACRVEHVPLTPRRDVRCIEGYLRDLLEHPVEGNREDYLRVTLLDDGALLDAMGQLREVYPNVLHLERPALDAAGELRGNGADHRQMGVDKLFASFFEQVAGSPLSEAQERAFNEVVEDFRRREREAVS